MALYSLNLCIAYTQGIKKSVGRGVKAAAQIQTGDILKQSTVRISQRFSSLSLGVHALAYLSAILS